MPAEYRQREASLWISKRRENPFNTPFLLGPDFLQATSVNPLVLIPEMEKTDDALRTGNASEFPTAQCNQYWLPPTTSIQDQANFDLFGRLALRAAGGPVIDTPVVGAAHRHSANMLSKAAGLQYPGSTVVSELGGASFLFAGNATNTFRMSQEGVSPVQCSFDLLGTGKHRSPHQIGTAQVITLIVAGTVTLTGNAQVTVTAANMPGSPRVVLFGVVNADTAAQVAQKCRDALAADPIVSAFFIVSGASTSVILTARYTAANDTTMQSAITNATSTGITPATSTITTPGLFTLPTAPTFSCLKPRSFLEYTDDVGLQDLTLGCRVRSWFVELGNAHNPVDDRCIGDAEQEEGDFTLSAGPGTASTLGKLSRGDRTVNAQIVILLDNTLPQWKKMARNILLTNVTFGARGAVLDAGGPTHESLKVIIPAAWFSAVQNVDSNGKAALTLTFKAKHDNTAIGARVEVVNNIVNNYD